MEFNEIQGVKSGRRLEGQLGHEIHLMKTELLRQGLSDETVFAHPELNALRAKKNRVHAIVKKLARERKANRKKLRRERALADRPPRMKVSRTVSYRYDQADDARLADFYNSKEWRFMRYEALRLHGARCQCCGSDGRSNNGIHVDHIKPLRVFWDLRLELNNLQVLCGDCNEGKGARHADDWRS